MQAPGSLSALQRDSLESTFSCLRGIASFLDSILPPDEKLIAGNLRDLAGECQRKLVEVFTELLEWLRELERRGGGQ
jgi:hypothetical protein